MENLKHRFIELRAEGNSYSSIAKKLNKSKVTLIQWNKELSEEIANSRAVQLETLYEKYFLVKEKSLKLFGDNLLKLKSELAKRTFDTIPTEKLLELLPKYHALLKDELIELNFETETEMSISKQDRQNLDALISALTEN